MIEAIELGLISFITSFVAAVIGFGGGMLLIAILPSYLSSSIVIPIHGLTQLASNSSRMLFSWQHVRWELLWPFLLGSTIGTLIFGLLITQISLTFIPLFIGAYILLNLWCTPFQKFISRFENYYLIGFLQTGLGLIVGATGPLSLTVLAKQLSSKDAIVATSALFMTVSHLAKIPVFAFIGVELLDHLPVIFTMILGSILGSWIGTQLRVKANNDAMILLIKLLLSALATHTLMTFYK